MWSKLGCVLEAAAFAESTALCTPGCSRSLLGCHSPSSSRALAQHGAPQAIALGPQPWGQQQCPPRQGLLQLPQ